jgi:cytochrome c oxidase subunit 2
LDTSFQLLPDQASTIAPHVDALFFFIVAVALFFTVVVAGFIFVFAIRYRRRAEDYFPKPIVGSNLLESAWTIVPLIIALGIFFWGARVYFDIVRMPDDALEIYVVAKQWMWHLQHPEGQSEINALHVPVGRPVKLVMTSEDVIHNFSVPAFRVKQDVVPGRYTYLWFQATTPGNYRLYCAAFCGTEHSRMIGQVTVMEAAEYEHWLLGSDSDKSVAGRTGRADRSLALEGGKLFRKLQCISCHSATAEARAPVLEELYGKTVHLVDGKTVRADESYIRESILVPDAKIVAGYRPIMPPFPLKHKDGNGQVSEDDLVKLIAFIKSLRKGDTPSRVEDATTPDRDSKLPLR